MAGAKIIHALTIAADSVHIKAVYRHSIHDAGVLRNIRLITHHGAHFIPCATVISLAVPKVCSRKRINAHVDRFVVAVGAGYFDDNNLVTATFYNLHILVRKNIYIDDGMIVDAVPEIYDKFFGGGEWYTGKAFICIFYNTKQNVATKSIGKS